VYKHSPLTPHDLLLLEYPHAPLPDGSAPWAALRSEYLEKAAPCRPIVYLRADWFIKAALNPPLRNDLRAGRAGEPPAGLAGYKERRLEGPPDGQLLIPLDGETYPNHDPKGPSVRVLLETLDHEAATRQQQAKTPQKVFRPGGRLVVRLTNRGEKPV